MIKEPTKLPCRAEEPPPASPCTVAQWQSPGGVSPFTTIVTTTMQKTAVSVVTSGGVSRKRTTVREDVTLRELYEEFKHVPELDMPVDEYHAADKRVRTQVKLGLPYFVGGVLDGPRDDKHVAQRTLLTLDIEKKPKQSEHPPPPSKVVDVLRRLGMEAWVYTSISHTPEAPRYRVVLPLRKNLPRGEGLQAATLHAAEQLGVKEWCAAESWVLSQPMFLPVKLKGAKFQQWHVDGKGWRARTDTAGSSTETKRVADIPDTRPDPMVTALKAAGLYLEQDADHPGRHYFTCPWADEHSTSNPTQTVYFEPHFNGHSAWGCKCMGTGPDIDGKPHMTRGSLTRWLVEQGHLDNGDDVGEMEEYDKFDQRVSLGSLLQDPPPPQQWAVPDFAPIGAVTLLAAPGGQGKSLLVLHILAHAALGIAWAGFRLEEPMTSLYVSYEDGMRQVYDRLVDIREDLMLHDKLYDVHAGLEKNLLIHRVDDPGTWLFLYKPDRFSPAERTARVEWLVGYLKHRKVRMVVFDPMVYTHQLAENDIADMALYMQTLNHIAKAADCAVLVVHHMSKLGRGEQLADMDAHSLRGASSISDNARSAAVLVGMPFKDAAQFGVTEREALGLAVFKQVKSNYAAPLDLMVFERVGRLLRWRPDLKRLEGAEVRLVKEAQADKAKDEKMALYARQALGVMAEHKGGISQNQVALGGENRWSPQRAKSVLAWCEAHDLCEVLEAGGGGRGNRHAITPEGRRWLRDNKG